MSGPELNYSIVEKKYLSLLLASIHFKKIIQGCYTEIYTDNRNCLFDTKKATSRISRLSLLMNEFNYKIIHIDGSKNVIADRLSRCLSITEIEIEIPYKELIFKIARKMHKGC